MAGLVQPQRARRRRVCEDDGAPNPGQSNEQHGAMQTMHHAPYNKRRCRRVRGESWSAVRRREGSRIDRAALIDCAIAAVYLPVPTLRARRSSRLRCGARTTPRGNAAALQLALHVHACTACCTLPRVCCMLQVGLLVLQRCRHSAGAVALRLVERYTCLLHHLPPAAEVLRAGRPPNSRTLRSVNHGVSIPSGTVCAARCECE